MCSIRNRSLSEGEQIYWQPKHNIRHGHWENRHHPQFTTTGKIQPKVKHGTYEEQY